VKERVRVVVGDDHPLIREAIRRRFQATEDIELVGEAASGEEILELLAKEDGSVDLAILDIHMPPVDGIETTRMIREKHPEVEVLILTGTAELVVVLDGLRMGAKGYVLKHRDAQFLIDAVRLVANGNVMIDPDFVDALAEHLTRSKDPDDSLTRREVELLQLVALGRNNSEAGHTLLVSEGTVKADLHRIMSKLGANDRTSAVAEAFRRRLIE
jgi:DNA-binding NarL/FixJ family response regulator